MNLVLERRDQHDATVHVGPVALPPPLGGDYWAYRVRLSERQAILGFPKFDTIGIGFAVESASSNTNLPFRMPAEMIAEHIAANKGDDLIPDTDVVEAIRMIRAACVADGRPSPQGDVLP